MPCGRGYKKKYKGKSYYKKKTTKAGLKPYAKSFVEGWGEQESVL